MYFYKCLLSLREISILFGVVTHRAYLSHALSVCMCLMSELKEETGEYYPFVIASGQDFSVPFSPSLLGSLT